MSNNASIRLAWARTSSSVPRISLLHVLEDTLHSSQPLFGPMSPSHPFPPNYFLLHMASPSVPEHAAHPTTTLQPRAVGDEVVPRTSYTTIAGEVPRNLCARQDSIVMCGSVGLPRRPAHDTFLLPCFFHVSSWNSSVLTPSIVQTSAFESTCPLVFGGSILLS